MIAARATLVLAAAFVAGGAAFDSPSLYVPGVALAIVVLGSRLWVRAAARRARVEGQAGPWTIGEEEPYPLEVWGHAGRLPLPGGRIIHPLADRPAPVPPRSSVRARVVLRSLPRGRHELEPATLELADPFRLHTVRVRGSGPSSVLVLPRIEPVIARGETGGGNGDGSLDGLDGLGAAGLDTRPIDFEVDGLRPYRHGGPASRIHWPTVARVGEMVEHRLVAGADAMPLVILDSSAAADGDGLDRAVRAAASLCVHLAPRRGCALALTGERAPYQIDPQLRAWPQAHARLAVVRAGGAPPTLRRASTGVTFWVTASPSASMRMPGPPGAGGYLVTASPIAGLEAAFSVAGCDGHRWDEVRRRTRLAAGRAA